MNTYAGIADMGIADVPPAGASAGIIYGLDSKETLTRGGEYEIKVNQRARICWSDSLLQRMRPTTSM